MTDDMTWKEIKRKVGEMASMENDLRQAQGSRDYWKDKCYRFAQDVGEHYVTLPIDAGGGTIRPGVMVMHDGKTWAVRTLMLTDEGEWLLDCQPEDGEPPAGRTVKPEGCVVVERRTVEDVLREVVTLCHNTWKEDSAFRSCDVDDVMGSGNIADYADELRSMLDA